MEKKNHLFIKTLLPELPEERKS